MLKKLYNVTGVLSSFNESKRYCLAISCFIVGIFGSFSIQKEWSLILNMFVITFIPFILGIGLGSKSFLLIQEKGMDFFYMKVRPELNIFERQAVELILSFDFRKILVLVGMLILSIICILYARDTMLKYVFIPGVYISSFHLGMVFEKYNTKYI